MAYTVFFVFDSSRIVDKCQLESMRARRLYGTRMMTAGGRRGLGGSEIGIGYSCRTGSPTLIQQSREKPRKDAQKHSRGGKRMSRSVRKFLVGGYLRDEGRGREGGAGAPWRGRAGTVHREGSRSRRKSWRRLRAMEGPSSQRESKRDPRMEGDEYESGQACRHAWLSITRGKPVVA